MHRLTTRSKSASLGGLALAAGISAIAAFGSAPAGSATNAGLTIDTPCVRDDGSKVAFHLAGFAPDSTVEVQKDGSSLAGLTVGADGSYAGTFSNGSNGTELFYVEHSLTATDGLGSTGSAKYGSVTLGVVAKPVTAKLTAKVSYYAQGFVEGGTLYAHYAYSKSDTVKQHLKTIPVGALVGPCGTITTKKLTQLPIKKAKKGVYEIQFDTRKDFQRQVAPYATTTVFVAKNQKK